jgi:hypothetical protein
MSHVLVVQKNLFRAIPIDHFPTNRTTVAIGRARRLSVWWFGVRLAVLGVAVH